MATIIGEFGSTCGFSIDGWNVFEVVAVHGHTAEIRKLWRELDDCSGSQQYEILRRLNSLGALVTE